MSINRYGRDRAGIAATVIHYRQNQRFAKWARRWGFPKM
jgi:hypothetical protein